MTLSRSLATLLCAVALGGCFEESAVQDITGPAPQAAIRFYNFSFGSPGVNYYANDTKMTAIQATACSLPPLSEACTTTGAEATTGVVYGATGVNSTGLYSAIAPGPYTFTGRIAAATDKDLAIATLPATIEAGKYYSFYQSGIYNATTKSSDAFIVEDPIPPAIDFTVATVRFVNAIHNANPLTLYARNTTTNEEVAIGGAVPYKGAGAFVTLPSGIYDLNARYTGSATNVITRTAVGFGLGRVYTISARGDITVTSATATNRPILDNTANR